MSQNKLSLTGRLIHWANAPYAGNAFLLQKFHSFIRIILITVREFGNNELTLRSSALTYTIMLSLVPMLAMSTAVVKGLGGGNELRQVVYSYIGTLEETTPFTHIAIPRKHHADNSTDAAESGSSTQEAAPITDDFRAAADQIFNYVDKTNFATLGTIGVLGVLLSAILVLGNIELAMNTIWHVPAGRSLLRKVTDYLTFLILMPLSINFGFAANAVLKNDTLLNKLIGYLPGPWIQTALLLFVPLFFISITLFLIYLFFPNTKVKTVPALIGALFAGTLWFITQNFYIGLQIGVSKYNAIYGSFATVPLFLVWMFLGWVFILGGAQLAFACQRQSNYQLKKTDLSPTEQLSAAFDILNILFVSYDSKETIHRKDLPGHCPPYTAEMLFSCLKKLTDAKLIAITKKERLLPAVPAEQLQYHEIVSAILGKSFPTTEGGRTAASLFQQTTPLLNKSFSEKSILKPTQETK
ncbi:MAG: YihY/virulence factor BrkB family protein [Desulfocapsa sp.]|nr:YihY/virulence factor BrkB family protein [Desulfocapsa sp.]